MLKNAKTTMVVSANIESTVISANPRFLRLALRLGGEGFIV